MEFDWFDSIYFLYNVAANISSSTAPCLLSPYTWISRSLPSRGLTDARCSSCGDRMQVGWQVFLTQPFSSFSLSCHRPPTVSMKNTNCLLYTYLFIQEKGLGGCYSMPNLHNCAPKCHVLYLLFCPVPYYKFNLSPLHFLGVSVKWKEVYHYLQTTFLSVKGCIKPR